LLDEAGLAAALQWYVDGVSERSGLNFSLSLPDGMSRFSRDAELVVFRVVQECLTNVHRHSGSKRADIKVNCSEGGISIQVSDYGKGMSAEKLAGIRSNASGVGIRGMRERVHQLGGQFVIESNNLGTKVFVSLPGSPAVSK
jgi:signal transduction histidine kinase